MIAVFVLSIDVKCRYDLNVTEDCILLFTNEFDIFVSNLRLLTYLLTYMPACLPIDPLL